MMWVGDTVGISYETAGHALNTLFFTLVVVFFVSTVRAFGGRSRSITWIAMLIALAHPFQHILVDFHHIFLHALRLD